jgi:dTDP-4-amino-4,6-dideoxygalactose transaminase
LPGLAYHHDEVGYNYRLSNIAAALGLSQLECLADFLEVKKVIADRYEAAFAELNGIEFHREASWAKSSHWLSSASAPTERAAEQLIRELTADGIGVRPIWTPIHQNAPYCDASRIGGAVADDLAARSFSLPSSTNFGEADQKRVMAAVRRFVGSLS